MLLEQLHLMEKCFIRAAAPYAEMFIRTAVSNVLLEQLHHMLKCFIRATSSYAEMFY